MRRLFAFGVAFALGCASTPRVVWPTSHPIAPDRFNHVALRLDLPLYWVSDDWTPRQPQARDIRQLLFYPASSTPFVEGGEFTPAFESAIALMRDEDDRGAPTDEARSDMIWRLDHMQLSLIETDFTRLDAPHQAFLDHVIEMTRIVDALFATQQGIEHIAPSLDPLDLTAQSAMRMSLGCSVWHELPAGTCWRLASPATAWLGVDPIALQMQPNYCAQLASDPRLRAPTSVIVRTNAGWGSLPDAVAYANAFARMRVEMLAAADALAGAHEADLVMYLRETARHFELGPDDRDPWARFIGAGSRWYVGVGAHQAEWDPCGVRRAIGLTFGTIDPWATERVRWVIEDREAMEAAIADVSNGTYAARDVSDVVGPVMVHVVVQGGQDRYFDTGAFTRETAMVVETNTSFAAQSARLDETDRNRLCWGLQEQLPVHETLLLSAALHESGHALGPPLGAGRATFGARAQTIDELIAEATNGFLVDWAAQRGRIDEHDARRLHQWQVRRAIGSVVGNDARDPHSAAELFLLGRWIEAGAVRWEADQLAYDGQGQGCFALDFTRFGEADAAILAEVLSISAIGDRVALDDAVTRYVDGGVLPIDILRARRVARHSEYVYAIDR